MLGGSDTGDPLRELVDEIIALVLVAARQFLDAPARLAILQLVEIHQRHRMNLDAIGDDELNPRQTDAVARQLPPTKRGARASDIEHDRRARLWQLFEANFLLGEIEQAVVNKTFIALRAGERHFLAVPQNFCCLTSADNRRNAKLAANDCSVTRATAEVGNDTLRLFENRAPVGIGHFSNEDAALLEFAEIMRAFDATHFCSGNGLADAQTGEEPLAFSLESVSRE